MLLWLHVCQQNFDENQEKYVFFFILVFKGFTQNFSLQDDDIRAIQALYGMMMFE